MSPSSPAPSCRYMAALIELLSERPAELGGRQPEVVAERLDRLERDARANGAAEATLTAIQDARALLRMAELPVRLNDGQNHENRRCGG